MKVVSIIPARAGSKGIPGKNIKLLGGYPLIAYSIVVSKLSSMIGRTMVSTDSQEIANIALFYGAEVPFLRPAEISRHRSTDLEFIQHTIGWLEGNKEEMPDLLVLLRPTTPLRRCEEVESAIVYLEKDPNATSLRSAHALSESPHKMFQTDERGYFQGFFPKDARPEYHDLSRQLFPTAYHPNGYVDIVRVDMVRKANLLWGQHILAFVTDFATEIDLPENFEYLEYHLGRYGNPIHDYLKKFFPEEEKIG